MKRISLLICFFLLMFATTGCMNTDEPVAIEPPVVDEPVFIPEQELGEDEGEDEDENGDIVPTLFDYAELAEEDFPRGMWTINQLIDKYGIPKNIEAVYSPEEYELVFIDDLVFEEATVALRPLHISHFSGKVGESIPEYTSGKEFELSEQDKNVEFEVIKIAFFSEKLDFPYGIKIGQSTKAEVLAAYPAETASVSHEKRGELYYGDGVFYYYDSLDENGILPEWQPQTHGSIQYFFDENDVLESVSVLWRWSGS